jgi:hypothetical protein
MTMTANFLGPSEGGTHPSGDTPETRPRLGTAREIWYTVDIFETRDVFLKAILE